MRFRFADSLTNKKSYPERSHWIKDSSYMMVVMKYICSGCGNRSASKDNYCSYCGARMDEEVNEVQEVKDGVIISINKED